MLQKYWTHFHTYRHHCVECLHHFPPKLPLCVTGRQWLVQTDAVFRMRWALIRLWTLWEINWFTAEQEAVAANKQQYKHGQSERGFIVNTEEWPRTPSYWYQINIAPGLFILILIHGISTLDSKEEGTINVEIDFSMRL